MANQYISNENRHRIIEAYLNGHTVSEIAEIFGFNRTSVKAVRSKHKNNESIERGLKRGPRRKALNELQKNTIISWIDDDCGLTLAQLKRRCENEFNIHVSKSIINRCIGSFKYSLKRVSNIPIRRNDIDSINSRFVQYWRKKTGHLV
ncbi:hypothetical protein ENBRE01_2632 [Enteropsectra breve]|nr:hypothetical protein ENBRE01_2632 [Enteropsectra breve]